MGATLYAISGSHSCASARLMIEHKGVDFRVTPDAERRLREQLPSLLDQADELLAQGTIGSTQPNVADMLIAASLALLDYRLDLREELRAPPLFALVERLLPEPL